LQAEKFCRDRMGSDAVSCINELLLVRPGSAMFFCGGKHVLILPDPSKTARSKKRTRPSFPILRQIFPKPKFRRCLLKLESVGKAGRGQEATFGKEAGLLNN
jgi:hypothetical protein